MVLISATSMDVKEAGSINNEPADAIENEIEEDIIDDSEERELVTDSCSTKVRDTSEQPRDNYWVVYLLFYLFGITSLVSWNFLITANDYWMYKFRDVSPVNSTQLELPPVRKTQFQAEFTSYLNVAASIPNLIFLILNSLYGHLVSVKSRLQGSLLMITLSFLVTTAFVQIDTDEWQNTFFIITMVTVVVMSAASAIFIGGLVGIASRFSKEYMAAVISGQSLGGIIAAIAQIISLAFKISPLHSALIYFIIADIMLGASLVSYIMLYKIDFFTHHILRGSGVVANRHREVSMIVVMKKIWVYAFSIFAIFAISMAVYPAVTVLVESHPTTQGTDWNKIYFVPVVNYLIFNCGDYSGRLVAGFLLRPLNQWVIAAASLLRIIGVPMLMLCNAQPRPHHLPVIFEWDYEYIMIMIVFAFSNGYLTNIVMINSTRVVELHEREKATSVIATLLSIGLTVGAAVGMLLVHLL
ncbi:equilibrative nucleoside transporter 3 [Leguminivora glycinivorella]|uniref:equilibrative nucleoside transporter 3 n=1 Tax=Leguminivora glycinivorella TaxID=1035111 RepID=UPI00200FCBF8|nr:equilibrative nucleoside transporter 3 [Leguminivora glycinivorella]